MPGITHFPKHRNILRTSQTKPEMKHMQEVGPGGWGILADSGSSPSSGEPTPSRGGRGHSRKAGRCALSKATQVWDPPGYAVNRER